MPHFKHAAFNYLLQFFLPNCMAFFLPSSSSSSTTTSLSSSPLPVLHPLDSEDESRNELLPMHQSNNRTQGGFAMFGRQLDYISGASSSDMSSFDESSESDVESLWTHGSDNEDERSPRATREDARSPSRRRRQSPQIDQVAHLAATAGTSQNARVHQSTPRTSEPNVAPSTNQIEEEEAVKRRRRNSHRRRGSTEVDRRSTRREAKRRNRHDYVFDGFLSRDFFLIIILCFGMACAWIVLARPIMMNWFGSRSGSEGIYDVYDVYG